MQTSSVIQDFVHPELGREITAIGGHYVFDREIRLSYNSREVLYFVGYAVLDSTCCGVGGCAYGFVPGFIRYWKYRRNHDDCFVSKVEPIWEPAIQKDVREVIQKKEMVFQVTFA